MRGKLNRVVTLHVLRGITPAHAGKTFGQSVLDTETKDHPRACGENRLALVRVHCRKGSPPRMRGKRRVEFTVIRTSRITPAHAGKTMFTNSFFPSLKDHPRACGENILKF